MKNWRNHFRKSSLIAYFILTIIVITLVTGLEGCGSSHNSNNDTKKDEKTTDTINTDNTADTTIDTNPDNTPVTETSDNNNNNPDTIQDNTTNIQDSNTSNNSSNVSTLTYKIPSELVGAWSTSSGSVVDFYNPTTGTWYQPTGSASIYKFSPDGYYVYEGFLQSTILTCSMSFFMYIPGTITVEGSNLTLDGKDGMKKLNNTCGDNSSGPVADEIKKFSWRIGPDEFGSETLYLTSSSGQEERFYRRNNYCEAKIEESSSGTKTQVLNCFNKETTTSNDNNPDYTAKRSWTYMVYMGADNDLSNFGLGDLNEMELVGSNEKVNIVLQAEFSLKFSDDYFSKITYDGQTLRFFVEKDNDTKTPNIAAGKPVGNLNMASPETLKEFIIWAKTNYPADHYALVIWDHGAGWKESKLGKIISKGAVQDQTSDSFMTLPQLALAVRDSGLKLDVINFDACLMAMYEVAYEFRGLTDYMVFSEANEPGVGDPYDTILTALNANPSMSSKDLAITTVDKYYDYYNSSENRADGITKSAMDMSQIDTLHSKVTQLAGSIVSEFNAISSVVFAAQSNTQTFDFPENHDLYDLALYLENNLISGSTKTAATEVITAVGNAIVANKKRGDKVKDSYGLAIYVPSRNQVSQNGSVDNLKQYKELASNNANTSSWYDVIVKMTENTVADVLKTGGFAFYAEWDTDADVDLYVWEPCAPPAKPCEDTLYAPWMGKSTPNGFLSGDSYESGYSEEYYLANDYVEAGNYDVIINYVGGGINNYANVTLWYIDPSQGINDWTKITDQPVRLDLSKPYVGDFSDIQNLNDLNSYSNWWYPYYVSRTILNQEEDIIINSGERIITFRFPRKKVVPGITNLER